jgi:hypothetical protein
MSIISQIKKAIFGYDIFISYTRFDSLDYAYAIAQYFMKKGYECYIDQLSSITPGENLPPNIQYAVKRSTAFVLIGSEGAQKSKPIEDEVTLFFDNNKNKPLIPITIDGAINNNARWYRKIIGLALIDDTAENLKTGTPAQDVLDRIENALKFTKKSVRLRNIALMTLVGVITVSTAAAIYSYTETNAAKKAIADKEKADSQRILAMQEKDTALQQKKFAEIFKVKAESLQKEAVTARNIALKDKDLAQHSADAARYEAEKSGLIAKSNYLINLSNELPNKYSAVDTALLALNTNYSSAAEQNLRTLFLKYPFTFGGSMSYLDAFNGLLNVSKNKFYFLDKEIIKEGEILTNRIKINNKSGINGFPNIRKDSIIIVNQNPIIKYVISSIDGSIKKTFLDNSISSSLSEDNLVNNMLLRTQLSTENTSQPVVTISITDNIKKTTYTTQLNVDKDDKIGWPRIFYSNDCYFLFVEVGEVDIGKSNATKAYIFTLAEDFKVINRSVGYFDQPYQKLDMIGIIKYNDSVGANFLIVFRKGTANGYISDQQVNFITTPSPFDIDQYKFVNGKNILLVKTNNLLGIFPMEVDERSPLPNREQSIEFTDNFSFVTVGEKYVYILTREGNFYVLDLDINPNRPNDYISTSEINRTREVSKQAFFKFISNSR